MACVSEAEVLEFLRGGLVEEKRVAIEAHLDACAECLELITLAGKTSLAVDKASLAATLPAPPPPRTTAHSLAPGAKVGRYEIVEPLGGGGMGLVYVARDTQLARRVAIKVVHPSLAHLEHSQIGLLREAQAMARMTQPNVLTVYDTGIVDDAVFLAAELVEGETLEEWLAQPRRWRAIVEVFVQAARGLDAAHAAGLVHRDFKPANALVGRDGRVRVFDFGVARFSDGAAPGREIAGTPLYMSPEQQRGDVADARSDQYAFCVALHEALFGEHPVHPEYPPSSSGAIEHPPPWLREIVRRGLEADPERRFPAMRDVIAALGHGLGRRRRAAVGALAALAVSTAAIAAAVGYARGKDEPLARCPGAPPSDAWNAARRAQLASAFRKTGAPYAEATWAWTERELDRFATRWTSQRRDACLAFEVHDTDDAPRHESRTACLDQDKLVFEAILDRLGEVDRATAPQVPRLVASLPDVDACTRPELVAWPAPPAERSRVLEQYRNLARVSSLAEAGHHDDAARGAEALVRDAKTQSLRRVDAEVGYLAGHVAGYLGKYDDAVKQVDAALWLAYADGHDELVARATCELLDLVANRQHRPADAQKYVDLARASAARIGADAAQARAARAIGLFELAAGQFKTAEADISRALAWAEGHDPLLASLLVLDLANVVMQDGRYAASEPLVRRGLAGLARELGEVHPRIAQALNVYGNALANTRHYDEAREVFARAIALTERALGDKHPDLAKVLANAATVELEHGTVDAAIPLLERSAAVYEAQDPESVPLSSTLNNLAEQHRIQGDLAGAERIHRRALAIRTKRLGENHPKSAQSMLSIAGVVLERKDFATAKEMCERAARSVAGSDARNLPLAGVAQTCLGDIELRAGRAAQAVPILENALTLFKSAEDPGPRADTQFALAQALPSSQRARAIELARSARAVFADQGPYRAKDFNDVDVWLKSHAP